MATSLADLRRLIAALGGIDEIAREAAIARLAILGTPAADRLVAAWPRTTDRRARDGILQALERGADPRLLGLARDAIREGGDLAVAAAGVLRTLVNAPDRAESVGALDALLGLMLDGGVEHRVRVAAASALSGLEGVDRAASEAARRMAGGPDGSLLATWRDVLDGRLPDAPATLRAAVHSFGATAPLSELQRTVDLVRARERETPASGAAQEWTAVRGALHQALALRDSRVALYDLRETFETAGRPLPATFLAAMYAVGDQSCLEPLVAAWEADDDARWRSQVRDAFRAIVRRERLTRRAPVLRRIASKRPEAFSGLVGQVSARKA